jgi:WD40 repeat protein
VAYRFSHHKKLVNCVKFFSPPASDQLLLFTCGDDGAVRLYDFSQNHVQTKVIYGLQRS